MSDIRQLLRDKAQEERTANGSEIRRRLIEAGAVPDKHLKLGANPAMQMPAVEKKQQWWEKASPLSGRHERPWQSAQRIDPNTQKKIFSAGPQVLEQEQTELDENARVYEMALEKLYSADAYIDKVVSFYGGEKNADGSVSFPSMQGSAAYEKAILQARGLHDSVNNAQSNLYRSADRYGKAGNAYFRASEALREDARAMSDEALAAAYEGAGYPQDETLYADVQNMQEKRNNVLMLVGGYGFESKSYDKLVAEVLADMESGQSRIPLQMQPAIKEAIEEEKKARVNPYGSKASETAKGNRGRSDASSKGYRGEAAWQLFSLNDQIAALEDRIDATQDVSEKAALQKEAERLKAQRDQLRSDLDTLATQGHDQNRFVWQEQQRRQIAKANEEYAVYQTRVPQGSIPTEAKDWGYFALDITQSKDFAKYAKASVDGTSDKYSKAELSQFQNVNGQDYHGTVDDLNVNSLMQEEKAVHNYLFNHPQYGPSVARQYLESLREVLLYRDGERIADNVDYPVLRELIAFTSGLENAATGFKQHFYGDAIEVSASEIAMSMLQQRHKDGLAHYTLGAAQSLGNMAPSLLVSTVTGQPWLGAATMGVTSSGNATRQALQSGMSQSQARTYGLLVGASEAALQYVLGGIDALGGKASGGFVNKIASKVGNSAAKAAVKFGGSLAGEVLEENLQNYLEPAFQLLVGATDRYDAPGMDEFIDTTITTLMTTGLLESGSVVSNYQVAEFEKEHVKPWIEQALKVANGDSRVQSVALHLKGLLDSGETVTPQVFMDAVSQISENEVGEHRQAVIPQQESTSINDNPQTHTPEQMRIIEEYKNSTDSSLMTFIQKVRTLKNEKYRSKVTFDLGAVTPKQVQDVQALTGVDVSSYSNSITGGAVDHIDARHGVNGKADSSMADDADFARIGHVLQNYDSVELMTDESGNPILSNEWQNKDQSHAKMVRFAKKIDGTYYVVEAAPDSSKQQLRVVSAYIQKNSGSPTRLLNMEENTSPQLTSETPAGMATSAEDSIAQSEGSVNTDKGLIYETLVQMGVHKGAAQSLARQFDAADGLSAEVYAKGVGESFLYGMMNFSEQELHSAQGFAADLSAQYRKSIYDFGKTFSKNQAATEDAKLQQQKNAAKKNPKKKGRVHYEVADADIAQLTERQKTSIKALEKLAKALGVDFYLYRSEKNAQGKPIGENGWYDPKTGDIHIDIDAGENGAGTILFTAAHELSHFLHGWAPYKFKILADFLVEQYGAKGQSVADLIRAQQSKAKGNGRYLTWMQAYEEMVADAMETMLTDGKVMEKLALLKKKDKSFVQKIKEWFREFAAKLRRAYETAAPDTREGQMVAEMVDEIDRIQELFAEGLAQAGDRYKVLHGQKNSASEGEAMYSIREGLKADLQKVKDRTFDFENEEVEIGNTSDFLVNELQAKPMLITMPATKAYRAIVSEEQAIKDGQPTGEDIHYHELEVEGLYDLLVKSEHPTAAFVSRLGEKDSRFDRIVLVTDMQIGEGYGTVIVEVDSKKRSHGGRISVNKTITAYDKKNVILAVQSAFDDGRLLYIDKKSGHFFDSGRMGSNCPSAISESVRKKNIQNFWANVKWKKSGKHEMSFDGGQKDLSPWDAAMQKAQEEKSRRSVNSERSGASVSKRYLLANALESAARNRTERELLQQYKDDVAALEEQEKTLRGLQKEIHDISFAKGPRDKARLEQLKTEAASVRAEISEGDKRLLRLAASKPLRNLLERETARVTAETKAQDRATLKKYREETDAMVAELKKKQRTKVESRHKTVMRQKIKKLISQLNSLYSHGSKERNVKNGMKDTAASVLASAEVLFHDEFSDEDLIRNGIGTQLTGEENHLIGEYERLLEQRDLFQSRIEGVEKANGSEQTIRDLERMVQRINKQLAEKNKALAGVFERERNRINNATVSAVIEGLAASYKNIETSADEYIREAYDPYVYERLLALQKSVGGTIIKDMSMVQLTELYDALKMVVTTIQNANKLFVKGKAENVRDYSRNVIEEIRKVVPKVKPDRAKAMETVSGFVWDEMKPVYAFRRIGSKSLEKLYWDAVDAEGVFARDIVEAGDFISEQRKKHNYAKWDKNKRADFDMGDGRVFSLNVEQMMSIYAYSRRDQALDHMSKGGFIFNRSESFKKHKFGLQRVENQSETYRVDIDLLSRIIETLTPEQKAYAEAMQEYLSQMGKKGNEVSRAMYGVDLFNEKFYFPLRSAQDFLDSAQTELQKAQTTASLKNTGMAKETVPHASNPIVLSNFDDVWLEHVNKMSTYHAFVLPIENLSKVFNYTENSNEVQNLSMQLTLSGAFGNGAVKYLQKYIEDLNGGVMNGEQGRMMSMFSKFKKTAVGASLSTAIQQPTAILRAMAHIRPDYFVPFLRSGKAKTTEFLNLYNELKQYAPIAIIKEMGGFDVGSNRQAKDYIGIAEYEGRDKFRGFFTDKAYRNKVTDDAFMYLASKGDVLGWTAIWSAVKKEVASKEGNFESTEAYLQRCGERFTEVVALTQVYDSVNSKSGLMRSKSELNKFATSFMGEPTTSINMLFDAILQAKRGGSKGHAARVVASVFVSTVAAAAAASVIYANRDDEDDEAWLEKWGEQFGGKLASELNVLNMIPYVRDIMSMVEGWDVTRPDMEVISNIISAYDNLDSDKVTTWKKIENFAGSFAAAFGLPVKNLMKDARGIYNVYIAATDDIEPYGEGVLNAFVRGLRGEEQSNSEKLYEAMIRGDEGRLAALRENYKNDSAFANAVRSVLKEHDSRIKKAAAARLEGDITTYTKIVKDITAEDHFIQDDILAAIKSQMTKIQNEQNEDEESTPSKPPMFDAVDYMAAVLDEPLTAEEVKNYMIQKYIDKGESAADANSAFYGDVRSVIGEMYRDGVIGDDTAMRYLVSYGGHSEDEAYWQLDKWAYSNENGSVDGYSKYDDFYAAVQSGKNLKQTISVYTDRGVDKETLASQITSYFKPLYVEMSGYDRAAIKGYLLNAYAALGYDRNKKSKDIDRWLEH